MMMAVATFANFSSDTSGTRTIKSNVPNSITETLYLTSIPGMKARLEEGSVAEVKDCVDFEW